jgi:hypothetical protein
MQVFSKLLMNESVKKKEKTNDSTKVLSWVDYYQKNINLNTYKLPELKSIARTYKLHVSGTKSIIIQRIETYFIKIKSVIKIQSVMRRYLLKLMLSLRGPALYKRNLCVNENDFYTLEPIREIHHSDFYSYSDSNGFIYGFDLNSMITMMKKQSTLQNPYNRDKFDITNIRQIIRLAKLSIAFYKTNNSSEQKQEPSNFVVNQGDNTILSRRTIILNKLQEIRNKPIQTRIQELFIEIDSLGNYTQSEWFSTLDRIQYIRLIRVIYQIWDYRSNMPIDIKHKICPYFNPFSSHVSLGRMNLFDMEQSKHACLTIFENLIYTGIDSEIRKIAALHVLSALTVVSTPARISMPWLYESLEYN